MRKQEEASEGTGDKENPKREQKMQGKEKIEKIWKQHEKRKGTGGKLYSKDGGVKQKKRKPLVRQHGPREVGGADQEKKNGSE